MAQLKIRLPKNCYYRINQKRTENYGTELGRVMRKGNIFICKIK